MIRTTKNQALEVRDCLNAGILGEQNSEPYTKEITVPIRLLERLGYHCFATWFVYSGTLKSLNVEILEFEFIRIDLIRGKLAVCQMTSFCTLTLN